MSSLITNSLTITQIINSIKRPSKENEKPEEVYPPEEITIAPKKHIKAVNFFAFFSVIAASVLAVLLPMRVEMDEIFPIWYMYTLLFSLVCAIVSSICYLLGDNPEGRNLAKFMLWSSSIIAVPVIVVVLRFYLNLILLLLPGIEERLHFAIKLTLNIKPLVVRWMILWVINMKECMKW